MRNVTDCSRPRSVVLYGVTAHSCSTSSWCTPSPRPTSARSASAGSGSVISKIEIARRVGENDTLYGWVTSADIAHALQAKGFDVEKRKIQLHDPLKALGETMVPVKIHRDVTAQVKVRVVAEQGLTIC